VRPPAPGASTARRSDIRAVDGLNATVLVSDSAGNWIGGRGVDQ
jgi:hypothetical protein